MSKYVVERQFSLDFLGKGWEKAHIVFKALTVKEMREVVSKKLTSKEPAEILDTTTKMVQDSFIRGMAPGEKGELQKLTKEDIEELPSQVIEKAIVFLVGELEPVVK